jgi:phosphoglycolate phosphatase
MPHSFPCARSLFLFDLDGTLVDSKADIAHSVNLALYRMHLPAVPASTVTRFVGEGVQRLIERTLRETSGSEPDPVQVEGMIKAFKMEYEKHLLDSTSLYDGVLDGLKRLWWASFAVVSNKPEKFSRRILEGLGVADRFQVILGGDSVDRRKPDPAPLIQAMLGCNAGPEDTVMVGDSAPDIIAGKAAGVITCGVTGGFGELQELEAAGCDLIVSSLAELAEYFSPAGNSNP